MNAPLRVAAKRQTWDFRARWGSMLGSPSFVIGARGPAWLEQRRADLLPTEYFHVVFTVGVAGPRSAPT